MNISANNATASDWSQASSFTGSSSGTQLKELSRAVQEINRSSMLPDDRELSMSVDPKTRIPVVRVLDSNTHEILDQLPAEYVLRVTAFLQSEAAQESLSKEVAANR